MPRPVPNRTEAPSTWTNLRRKMDSIGARPESIGGTIAPEGRDIDRWRLKRICRKRPTRGKVACDAPERRHEQCHQRYAGRSPCADHLMAGKLVRTRRRPGRASLAARLHQKLNAAIVDIITRRQHLDFACLDEMRHDFAFGRDF